MFCGDDEIDFDDFARAYQLMSSNMYTIAKAAGINFNLPITEMTTKADRQSILRDFDNLQLRILDLMEKFQDFDCKDPRDRMYALFELPGHSSDGLSISPDYTKSVEQVYTDLALECLSNDFGIVVLKVLHYAGAFRSWETSPSSSTTPNSSLSLPSWVPDWTCRARYHHFWNVRGKAFKAATDKEPCIKLSSQGQHHVLQISGFLLGHIKSCWSPDRLAQGDLGNSEVLQARVNAVYEEACAAQMGIPFALDEVRQDEVFEQLWSERIVFDAGFFGLGPPDTQAGDTVCLFHGAQTPFVIRRCEGDDFRIVGDAFVRDVMFGGSSDISKHDSYDFSIV